MENVGPINGSTSKAGSDFVKELLENDIDFANEEDEEERGEGEDEDEYYEEEDDGDEGEEEEEEGFFEETANQKVSMSSFRTLYDASKGTNGRTPSSSKSKLESHSALVFKRENSQQFIVNLSKYTLRKIIMLICDEADFLLEQKLVSLLKPLEKNEQSMVKLDAIFKSLGIQTENDIKLLAQYFINYRQYKELINDKTYTTPLNTIINKNENGEIILEIDPKTIKTVPHDKIKLIHRNDVVTALKAYVTLHHKVETAKAKVSKFHLSDLDNRDDSTDKQYWEKYNQLIDTKKEKVWDGLLYALQKYHSILNRRGHLIDENQSLANQNLELRMLLGQYMQSSINQELNIPPTKVLQMEYSN
jgi:hypothetical protein